MGSMKKSLEVLEGAKAEGNDIILHQLQTFILSMPNLTKTERKYR